MNNQTLPEKVFTTGIVDEYGYEFNQAVISLRDFKLHPSLDGTYSEETNTIELSSGGFGGGAYKANFWCSTATKAQGKKTRPLRVENSEGDFEDTHQVDFTHPEIMTIINGAGTLNDKALAVICKDIQIKFKP